MGHAGSAHLLHDVPFASLALVDVVAVRPWGSELFRLVAEHPGVFARIPEAMRVAMLRVHAAAIPEATLATIPGAGHLVHLDRPEALVRHLRSWLEQRRA